MSPDAGWDKQYYLSIVNSRRLHSREKILDDPIKQWQIDGGQLGNVHVFHRHQQNLRSKGKKKNTLLNKLSTGVDL